MGSRAKPTLGAVAGPEEVLQVVRRAAAALWGLWVWAAAVGAGLVFGMTCVLPFAVVPRGRRERFSIWGAVLWARFLVQVALLCRVRRTGAVELAPGQGAILLCNHRSWLDPVLLIAFTRSNGLSKREVLWIPVIGLFGWLTGAVFFDRSDPQKRARAREEVLALVEGGHRIQVFPEGTRSPDGKLRDRVYLRLAEDCFARGLPVVPCAVMGTARVLPLGTVRAYPGRDVFLDVGPAMWPSGHADAASFARACWAEVVARVYALEAQCPERDSNPHS